MEICEPLIENASSCHGTLDDFRTGEKVAGYEPGIRQKR